MTLPYTLSPGLRLAQLTVLAALLHAVTLYAQTPDGLLQPAFAVDSLQPDACEAFVDGRPAGKAEAEAVAAACGLAAPGDTGWAADILVGRRRDFRIALRAPVAVGTVCTPVYTGPRRQGRDVLYGRFVSLLRPEAPFPGDVTREEHWMILPPGVVKTLPEPAATRAIRVTWLSLDPVEVRPDSADNQLGPLLCLGGRFYSALDTGAATHSGGRPGDDPDVWVYDWREPRALAGLVAAADGRQPAWDVRILPASRPIAPAMAADNDWDALGPFTIRPGLQCVPFTPALSAHALRLTNAWAHGDGRLVGVLLPLVALGPDEIPPAFEVPPPPVRLSYDMPFDGIAAVQIHEKAGGRPVRRLYAETAKDKGAVADGWDLRDDAGLYVAPGDYEWRALVRPPFRLTYQMTAYNAGQPAWWAPPPGKGGGGWLADHGTPNAAAAMGDMMWFGSLCAESGHVAIATDLDGNKLWGTHHIAHGFRGPSHIACDTQAAYLVAHELVNRVIPSRDFQMRQVFTCVPTAELPWNPVGYDATIGGAVARDGRLYWSINAPPESWLASAFTADVIDPGKCFPGVGLIKGKGRRGGQDDKNYTIEEYDELMQLYATFLTGRTPRETRTLADLPLASSTQASFGDAPAEGELAGSVVVVFTQPVTVGAVLVPDARIKVFALNPELDARTVLTPKLITEMPGAEKTRDAVSDDFQAMVEELADDEEKAGRDWIPLVVEGQAAGRPGVAVAQAGGIKTTALRYQVKRLVYSQVMTHRLGNCAGAARRVFREGAETPEGGWMAERPAGRVFNALRPGVMALVWPQPQRLRGLAFDYPLLISGGRGAEDGGFAIDVWAGDGDPAAALEAEAGWQPVTTIGPDPIFNGYFAQTPTCKQADFGRVVTTRALRVRCMTGRENQAGFRAVVAWTPLGDDPADLPRHLNERISVLRMPALDDDEGQAVVERHIPLPQPGQLAFDNQGTLHAISDGRVVRVPLDDSGPPTVIVEKESLGTARGLAVDAEGFIYVADAQSATVRVFDPRDGHLARTIGAGRQQLGAWDPARLDNPMQIAVDRLGRLWVADASYQPKRIQRFDREGRPDRAFLGPTQYGSGGWLDHGDRTRIYYNGMRFKLDWDHFQWKLDSLVFRPGDPRSLEGAAPPERPVYHKGRRYLVGPCRMEGPSILAVICQEKGDVAVPAAAVGTLDNWGDVRTRPDLRDAFGDLDGGNFLFAWSDTSGDGQPQLAEVQTIPAPGRGFGSWAVGEDLTLYAVGNTGYRLAPTQIRDDGVPVYDLKRLETFTTFTHGEGARTQTVWGTEDGRIFMIGTRLIAADGKTRLWEYFNEFARHEGFYHSGFGYDRPPGVLNQEHKPIGHFRVGTEEYFVTNTDQGDLFCYTADGMFVGCIFGGPAGYGLRRWTMPEWEADKTDLSDVRLGQEHYQGCVVKADDGRVYAVAGHNHMSLVRVDGFEQVQRLAGALAVSAEDLDRTRDWDLQRSALEGARRERKACRVPFLSRDPQVTGELTSWPPDLFVVIHETSQRGAHTGVVRTIHAKGALAYSEKYLHVAARALDPSPMQNTARDPVRVFQGGDAVDVTLGLDPAADPARRGPVAGDLRLVFSIVRGEPTAVLYRPVAPDVPKAEAVRFESPVGMTALDQVKILREARVAVQTGTDSEGRRFWSLTAAVPWSALDAEPPAEGVVLRGDIGILRSDPNGVLTAGRLYWSGKGQTVVCDVPSEARLAPALWGELHFAASSLLDLGAEDSFVPTPGADVEDILGP